MSGHNNFESIFERLSLPIGDKNKCYLFYVKGYDAGFEAAASYFSEKENQEKRQEVINAAYDEAIKDPRYESEVK